LRYEMDIAQQEIQNFIYNFFYIKDAIITKEEKEEST